LRQAVDRLRIDEYVRRAGEGRQGHAVHSIVVVGASENVSDPRVVPLLAGVGLYATRSAVASLMPKIL